MAGLRRGRVENVRSPSIHPSCISLKFYTLYLLLRNRSLFNINPNKQLIFIIYTLCYNQDLTVLQLIMYLSVYTFYYIFSPLPLKSNNLFHSNCITCLQVQLWKLILVETALCLLSENSSAYCISGLLMV